MLFASVPWGYHVCVGNGKACRHYTRVKELSQGLSNFSENSKQHFTWYTFLCHITAAPLKRCFVIEVEHLHSMRHIAWWHCRTTSYRVWT